MLQWGHGDEAVEEQVRRPGTLGKKLLLQWGHGDEAVEELDAARRRSSTTSRFNGATAMKPWKRMASRMRRTLEKHASMGPRR